MSRFNLFDRANQRGMAEAAETETMATEAETDMDSFVVMNSEEATPPPQQPSLSLSVAPLNDTIGRGANITSTKICATIKASDLPSDDDRAPVDVVLALDVSGSMAGNKLELCKKTAELVIRELRPSDRFGLITFTTEAEIVIPVRKMNASNKELALKKIQRLRPMAATNISGGLGLALSEILEVESPNAVRTVFLLTDGLANQGITYSSGIVNLVQGMLLNSDAEGKGITIHTFGYGSDHDQNLLRDISESTIGGSYYFVDNEDNVGSAFGDALGGVLSVVAQNVAIKIQLPPGGAQRGLRLKQVHHKNKVELEDGSWKVNLGDFYAEESKDIVFEVELGSPLLPEGQEDVVISYAQVSMSFLDTVHKKQVSTSHSPSLVFIHRPPGNIVSLRNRHVAMQWMRIGATRAIEEAEAMGGRGQFDDARKLLNSQLLELSAASQVVEAESDPLVAHLREDMTLIRNGFANRETYEHHGMQLACQSRQTHCMQRCQEAEASSANTYRTSRKKAASRTFRAATLKKG